MRREDARYRFFLRQLQALATVYTRTAQDWPAEFMRHPSNVTEKEYGYRVCFPAQVLFEGGKWERTCCISTLSDLTIWPFEVPPVPLAALPALIQPRLCRLAAMTDWSRAETLPPPVHRALFRRFQQLTSFYHGRPLVVQPLPLPQRPQS